MGNLQLDQQTYNTSKLTLLSWVATALALSTAVASHYGSTPQVTDVCFYPESAQLQDTAIREARKPSGYTAIGTFKSEPNLSLGKKFCNPKKGQVGTIPRSYLKKAYGGSINQDSNQLALLSQGLRDGWLYPLTEVAAENPYKVNFGLAAILFGSAGLWLFRQQQDLAATLRPKYRATKRLSGIQSRYAIALAEESLQMEGIQLLTKLRGLGEANSRIHFLNSVTSEQKIALLSSMNDSDYYEFGYLLDNSASFQKFLDPSPENGQEVKLDQTAELVPTSEPGQVKKSDTKPAQQSFDADDLIEIETEQPKSDDVLFERIHLNKKGHLFIPCETGAGKTSMMLGAMRYLVNFGWKFSGSTTKLDMWGGLEKLKEDDGESKVIRLSSALEESDSIEKLVKRFAWLMKLLRSRQQKYQQAFEKGLDYNPAPYVFVLDEWLETLRIAKRYDSINKTKVHDDLIDYLNTFISTSRDVKIYIWIMAQDHQVQNAGINTGLSKNLAYIVLGQKGLLVSIEGALVGKSAILQDINIKQDMWATSQKIADANPTTSIVYTNIAGNEILTVPYLPNIKRDTFFKDESVKDISVEPKLAVDHKLGHIDNTATTDLAN